MRSIFTAGAKSFVFGFAIIVFLTLNQGVARAETVTIHLLSIGSFNNSIFFNANATLHGLTFNGTTFPDPIATADISAPSFSLFGSTLNLGSFTLTGAPATYTGNTFAIHLTFAHSNAPLLSLAGTFPSFPASLTGTVQSSADGSLFIDFNNTPSVFTVTMDGKLFHTFSLILDDIIIQPGQTVNIISTISQNSAVPEPTTLLMLSAGLAGVGTAIRKRRKTSL